MHTTGLSELIIQVDDVERVADFYREVVGLTPDASAPAEVPWFWTGEPGKSTRFAVNNGRAALTSLQPFHEHAPLSAEERRKKAHFAFQVPSDRFDAAVAQLKSQDVPVHGPIELDWMNARACYFWDPEGHLVEFWSPLDGSEARDAG